MLVTCFLCFFFFFFDRRHPQGAVAAMGGLRVILALACMVPTAMAVATTYSNCQSACNLGEMLCLNKNASSTLCSAVQSIILEKQKNDIPGAVKLVIEYCKLGGDPTKTTERLEQLHAKL